jgi:flagellin-specific chaperone FliS
MSLYVYLNRRLIQANVRRDGKAGKEALWLARNIADLWKRVAVAAAAEAKEAEAKR